MKIAVIIGSTLHSGGTFQQELSAVTILSETQHPDYTFVFFSFHKENVAFFRSLGITVYHIAYYKFTVMMERCSVLLRRWRSKFDSILTSHGIDLVYFLSNHGAALKPLSINYLFTVWDLCHRDFPEFPESRVQGVFEYREHLYRHALSKAVGVFVDSPELKAHLIRRYAIDDHRVHIQPYLPSSFVRKGDPQFIDVKRHYGVSFDYVFYPAQFWPHKNHIYILDAISRLKERGIDVAAVFSGGDRNGRLAHLLSYAKKQTISDRIHAIGFAPSEHLASLYRQSLGLVMPTYFGPTNIPPLEAFFLKVPVIYADLPQHRGFIQDHALLCDLNDPDSLAAHIQTLKERPDTVAHAISSGYQAVTQRSESAFWQTLKPVLDAYHHKRRTWSQDRNG